MPALDELRLGDPERLGPYRLSGRLGEGGQGVVYLGEAADGGGVGGRVAIKLLRTGLGNDPQARARFMRELETAKRVAEFCTAAILDADLAGDRPYIVSEFVDGPSLRHVVATEGPRAGGSLERLAIGTATALVAIHRAGVVHRDFKPHNVLLGPDGPRVIDFGIARALDGATITSSGAIGTPAYMAPEQLTGERAGHAADVFAWAATMVFASCGRPAFGDDTLPAVIARILHEKPDLGALTGPLRDLAVRCLAKDPAERPSASEVLRALLGEMPGARDSAAAFTLPVSAGPADSPAPAGHRVPPYDGGQDDGPGHAGGGSPPQRRTATVVAVSAAVVAVAAAVVVSVIALSAWGGGGGSPSASPSASSGIPAAYGGTWKGQVRQNDGKMIPVTLALRAGGREGRIEYPRQRCSGVETYLGKAGGTLTFREKITVGAERCVDTGTVTLTPESGHRLIFSYTGTSDSRTFTVVGPLSRA